MQAQEFAQEDKEKKEKAEKVNLAENLAYTAEKTINDNREKLTEDEIKKVTDQVALSFALGIIVGLPEITTAAAELLVLL